MGNCCGKPAGNFHGEGRTLGSQPAQAPVVNESQAQRSSLPANVNQAPSASRQENEPLSAAGKAAQERMAKANAATGKLGQQLVDQKKQTRTDTLKAASEETRLQRDAQANAEARNWN